jgi:hypothetical protein
MLSEYRDVRQREGEGFRRWFSDPYFDVIVWYEREGGAITGYQVCYDKGQVERAFTKKREEGLVQSHRYVANGPVEIGSNKMTSILKGDASAVDSKVLARLRDAAGDLDGNLVDLILADVEAYNSSLVSAARTAR